MIRTLRSIPVALGAAACALALAPTAAGAASSCASLGTPASYSLYGGGGTTIGGGSAQPVSSGGPIAIGGSTVLDDATFATADAATPSALTFVDAVTPAVTAPVVLAGGSGEFVGSGTVAITDTGGGTVSAVSSSPISFPTISPALKATSTSLAAQAQTGSLSTVGSTLTLSGASSGVNYFTLTSSSLSGITTVDVSLSGGGVAVVNLASTVTTLSGLSFAVSPGTDPTDVLYNSAGSLTLDGFGSIAGSVLAGTSLTVTGTSVATSVTGSLLSAGSLVVRKVTQAFSLFAGCGPGTPLPESPFTPLFPVLGVVLLGSTVYLRRRRGAVRRA